MRSEIGIFICLAGLAFSSKNMIYTSERSVNIIENKLPPKALPTFYSFFFWQISTYMANCDMISNKVNVKSQYSFVELFYHWRTPSQVSAGREYG